MVKTNLKKTIFSSLAIILSIAFIAFAGTLTPPSTVTPAPTMVTLNDLYYKIVNKDYSTSTHTLSTTSLTSVSSGYSLDQIYDAIPTINPFNIKTGTTVAGISGVAQKAFASLQWSGTYAVSGSVGHEDCIYNVSDPNWNIPDGEYTYINGTDRQYAPGGLYQSYGGVLYFHTGLERWYLGVADYADYYSGPSSDGSVGSAFGSFTYLNDPPPSTPITVTLVSSGGTATSSVYYVDDPNYYVDSGNYSYASDSGGVDSTYINFDLNGAEPSSGISQLVFFIPVFTLTLQMEDGL